jgi:hypothetical protein
VRIDSLEVAQVEEHESAEENGRYFGDRDWILPYSIGVAVAVLGIVALLTVGPKAMALSTFLAFAALMAWLVIGLGLVLIYPIMIGVSERWKKERKKFAIPFFALLGIGYFVLSGFLMANSRLPI